MVACIQRPGGVSWEKKLVTMNLYSLSNQQKGKMVNRLYDCDKDVPDYYCHLHNSDTKKYPVSPLAQYAKRDLSALQKQYDKEHEGDDPGDNPGDNPGGGDPGGDNPGGGDPGGNNPGGGDPGDNPGGGDPGDNPGGGDPGGDNPGGVDPGGNNPGGGDNGGGDNGGGGETGDPTGYGNAPALLRYIF